MDHCFVSDAAAAALEAADISPAYYEKIEKAVKQYQGLTDDPFLIPWDGFVEIGPVRLEWLLIPGDNTVTIRCVGEHEQAMKAYTAAGHRIPADLL